MFSLVAFGVLSFITNSFAICPENPALHAEECVDMFARFGNASQQGPEAILQICSEIYDCLREMINDCGVFSNMGIQQISPEDYERMKSGIDVVCVGDRSTNHVVSDISKRAIAIDDVVSDISKRVNAIGDVISDISKRDDDTVGDLDFRITRQECYTRLSECVPYLSAIASNLSDASLSEMCMHATQAMTCLEEFSSKCSTVFPNIKLSELEDSIVPLRVLCNQDNNEIALSQYQERDLTQSNTFNTRATEKKCQEMGESCLAIVESLGIARGQREVMCNGIRSMLSCLQNVLTECADQLQNYNVDTMMAAYQQQLGIYCNGNENEIGRPGPRPGRPGPMAGGPGPQQVLSQCENKFNECGQYGAQLEAAGALDPVARCVVMRQHVECNDQLLADCGSIMPDMIKQRLAATGQQYNQICPGGNKAVVPKKKTGRLSPAKCEAMISKCKRKLLGYEAGNKEKCLQGYKTMRCYRRAAKVCKLTRPIRKEIKAFKKSHINTCGKKKPRAVDDVYDLDGLDDSFDIYIAWLDGDDIDAD
ncbi:uncharacterized protein LOC126824165 isoform X8 [Patella vulgata]|uniref:uncharacterized protein LOC126824165 isoform X8 n=1 Tax=Patella vulgata TaxID=6465 RepID=UPI0024A82C92|nr:uncharacterized protein LOC126824165 isoform X8 [Patella vulgata]